MEGLLKRFVDNAVSINTLKAERLEITMAMDEEARGHMVKKHAKDMQCVEDFDVQGGDQINLYLKSDTEVHCYHLPSEDIWFLRFFGHDCVAEVDYDGTIDADTGLTTVEREFITKHGKALLDVAEALRDEWFTYKYDREKYIYGTF
jgi:hypothetical protein